MYITKYALKRGIETAEILEKCNVTNDYTKITEQLYLCEYRNGKRFYCEPEHIFDSLENAVEKSENMRNEEIKKLTAEISRIKNIVF